MKRGLAYKLIRITLLPLVSITLILFFLNNYMISTTLESDLKKKMEISLDFLKENLSQQLFEEKNKMKVISGNLWLNYLLKYGIKIKNSDLYLATQSEEDENIYYVSFEKANRKIDYLFAATLLKKELYGEGAMYDKSLEIFDRHGKRIAGSSALGSREKTGDFDFRVNRVLNFQDEIFEKKNHIIDLEEINGDFVYKIMVPVPNRRTNLNGVLVLTYPVSKDFLRKMHSKLESGIFLLNKDFLGVENSYESRFEFDFQRHKEAILAGEFIGEKDENGEYFLKFYPLKNMKNEVIAYIGLLKDKTQIKNLEAKLHMTVGIVVLVLILIFSLMAIIEANMLVVPLRKLIFAMENIEKEKYETIEKIKLPKELDIFRKKFNLMVKRIGEQIKDIRKRDEALVTMNEELLAILKEKDRVYKSSITDGLTQVYNHKYFQKMLLAELSRSIRYDLEISVILLDIDFFKNFNDKFGHQLGDEALVKVANYMKDLMRGDDLVARYGGEEFIIVLPNTGVEGAMVIAERIRSTIEGNTKGDLNITVSAGVASYPENLSDFSEQDMNEREQKNELIRRSDVAMYTAKKRGRNQIVLYERHMDINVK